MHKWVACITHTRSVKAGGSDSIVVNISAQNAIEDPLFLLSVIDLTSHSWLLSQGPRGEEEVVTDCRPWWWQRGKAVKRHLKAALSFNRQADGNAHCIGDNAAKFSPASESSTHGSEVERMCSAAAAAAPSDELLV